MPRTAYDKADMMRRFCDAVFYLVRQYEVLRAFEDGHGFARNYRNAPSTIEDVMAENAVIVWEAVNAALANDIVSTLGRLTDPKGTGQNENLVLDRFIEDNPVPSTSPHRSELDTLLKLIHKDDPFIAAIRHIRHKEVAHNDLKTIADIVPR